MAFPCAAPRWDIDNWKVAGVTEKLFEDQTLTASAKDPQN